MIEDYTPSRRGYLYLFTVLTGFLSIFSDSLITGVVVIFLILFIGFQLNSRPYNQFDFDLNPKVFLSVLLVLGLYLRLQGVSTESFIHPETISANLASSVVDNWIPQHPVGEETWRSFPHILLLAISGSLFGFSELSLRMVSVAISLATIIIIYYVGKELFSKEAGLISAAIMTLMSWQIVWGQIARMYALFQVLYLLSILSIYRAGNDPSKKNVALMLGLIIVSMFVHVTAYILPVVALIYLSYVSFKNNVESLTILKIILVVLVSGLFSSTVYFDYQWIITDRLDFGGIYYYNYYLSWIWNDSSALVFILGFIGFLSSFKQNRDIAFLFFLSVIPPVFVYFFLYSNAATPRYLYFTIPFFALYSSLTLLEASSTLSKRFRTKGLIVLMIFLVIGLSMPTNFTWFDQEPDYKSAYNYIDSHYDENDYLITSQSSPASYYFKSPDKTLIFPVWEEEIGRSYGERYSGSKIIDSASGLNSTLQEKENLWLVLPTMHYEEKWNPIVDEKLGDPEFESDNIKVWRR